MKELSIEEKSYVAYKELINRLEDVKNAIKKQNYGIAMDILCNPYPEFQITASTELKESEDERTRKEIINYLEKNCRLEWAAWLEKQGKQKSIDDLTQQEAMDIAVAKCFEQGGQRTDKVEPKFHVGDWIIHNKNTELANSLMLVVDKVSDGYLCKYRDGQRSYNIEFIDKEYRLWTIQDAKDGDVLAYNDSKNNVWVCIFKEYANERVYDYCTLDKESFWERGNWNYLASFSYTPATKEQRDLLFQKMKEAGYMWDAEKKELKKIEHAAWSEGDEEIHRKCICAMRASACGFPEEENFVEQVDNWLKSLKDRYMPQPKAECSGEDKSHLDGIIFCLEKYIEDNPAKAAAYLKMGDIAWLKSLKGRVLPQPKQEWSKEDERIKNVSISFLEEFKEKGYENAVVCIDWLKSIHPRSKQEWGWNDSNILKDIDHILDAYKNQYHGVKPIEPIKEWLCHLNPQKQWKPSEEQIEALDSTLQYSQPSHNSLEHLNSLFNDLKKLREEDV